MILPIDNKTILQDIPIFTGASDEELALVKERCSFVEYKKTATIYEQGSPADAFYCVILGRVAVFIRSLGGEETVLEYLHRGKYFGIISLLTGEPHSVTARAVNDCLLLIIKKEDFELILSRIPRLAIDLSQTLSRRLKRKDIHRKTIFESTVISVFSSYARVGKSVYALNLALSLKRETCKSVLILDVVSADKMHVMPRRLDIQGEYKTFDLSSEISSPKDFIIKNSFGIDLLCLSYKAEESLFSSRLIAVLSLLINDYHYIVLDLPSYIDKQIFDVLNQSDFIHILTSPEPVDLDKTRKLIGRLTADFNFQEPKIKVVINEYKLSRLNFEQQREILQHDIFATLPKIVFSASDRLVVDAPESEYARAIRRVSRQAGERLVGLALGVGVAYGFCHIGVLKVIEEEKIPIDIIAGSSIGALIATLWATGKTSAEILEITREFKEPKYIWSLIDLTFPRLGFLKGNKLYRFLKKHLGNKTFHDIKLPLKIVASDIRKKEPRILESGLLIDAIMASCAMPGVFTPFKSKEELLLDGGVINPLPTEALFKIGVRKIIAVNVTPSREDILRQYERMKAEAALSGNPVARKAGFNFKEYLREKFKTNIIDLIFSSIEMMQSEMAQQEASFADVVLHPDTSGMYWMELHRSQEFCRRGEEEARRNLAKIWQMVNE